MAESKSCLFRIMLSAMCNRILERMGGTKTVGWIGKWQLHEGLIDRSMRYEGTWRSLDHGRKQITSCKLAKD